MESISCLRRALLVGVVGFSALVVPLRAQVPPEVLLSGEGDCAPGRPEQHEKAWKRARGSSGEPGALERHAFCLRALGTPEVALRLVEEAIVSWSDAEALAKGHNLKGLSLFDLGRYEDAIREFETAAAFDPSPGLDFNIWTSSIRLGRIDEATAALERILAAGSETAASQRLVNASVEEKDRVARVLLEQDPDRPLLVCGSVEPVKVVKSVKPRYPKSARGFAGSHGVVVVRLLIGREGDQRDIQILNSNDVPTDIENALLRALERWLFEPAKCLGRPVPVYLAQVVRY